MGGGGGRRAYKAAIDRLQELQPQLKYGNDNESLNVQEDVMSSALFYMMSLYMSTTGMTLKRIWMRYEPISFVTLTKACLVTNIVCMSVAPTHVLF